MRTVLRQILFFKRTLVQQVARLFSQGEQGVWYDISDFSTLFQDSAGTTPVTAVEQPVGLTLDKSKGLVLGAELVVNGDFSNGTTGWTAGGATLSVVDGELVVTNIGVDYGYARQNITTVVGKSYLATVTLRKVVTGTAYLQAGPVTSGSLLSLVTTSLTNVVLRGVFVATATTTNINTLNSNQSNGVGIFDNISVRELPGQHGKQATSAARPLLKASPTRIDYDAVDDTLVATFASSLGTDCTVCRAVPSVGASILTGQTIGTTYTDNTDHCGLIIINRALTASETSSVTAYLNAKAGV